MAVPADLTKDLSGTLLRDDQIRVQLNNLITAIRGIAAKLDADVLVADVNYLLLWADSTVPTAPVKIV